MGRKKKVENEVKEINIKENIKNWYKDEITTDELISNMKSFYDDEVKK